MRVEPLAFVPIFVHEPGELRDGRHAERVLT